MEESLHRYCQRVICNLSDQGNLLVIGLFLLLVLPNAFVEPVLGGLSQGTELKLADSVQVSLPDLCRDRSEDVLKGLDIDPGCLGRQARAPIGLEKDGRGFLPDRNTSQFVLEDDRGFVPNEAGNANVCHLVVEDENDVSNQAVVSESAGSKNLQRPDLDGESAEVAAAAAAIEKLFPNSFKVSGIKHICDNALSSILHGLPGFLGLFLLLISHR